MENAFYVFNRTDGTYMKYTWCVKSNLYTYVVGEGEENDVLLHSTVEGEGSKFSNINQTRAKAVRELQEVLASPSDYDLANAVKNNIVGSTPFTRRDIRIATVIHGRNVAALKGKTTKSPSKMPNPDKITDLP